MAGRMSFSLMLAVVMALGSAWVSSSAISQPLCSVTAGVPVSPAQVAELPPCSNSGWYSHGSGKTVFVFVHGLSSDSRTAWLRQVDGETSYWPELVRTDDRLGQPAVFLAGYPTSLTDGFYDIRAAANDLMQTLSNPKNSNEARVLDHAKIVFVAHSMGGIIVRHMLTRPWNIDAFKSKSIGLTLVASPSGGSEYANGAEQIDSLLTIFGFEFGESVKQLKINDTFLKELHKDFSFSKNRNLLPYMSGVELVENQFYINKKLFNRVVKEDSAARYFEMHVIPGSDHSSIATPIRSDPASSHEKLVAFVAGPFKQASMRMESVKSKPRVILMDSFAEIYDARNSAPGEMNSHVIQRGLADMDLDVNDIEPVHINWAGTDRIIAKHPDLLLIHYSAFDAGRQQGYKGDDLRLFLRSVLKGAPNTKIIVYTRTRLPDVTAHVRSLVDDAGSRSRLFGVRIEKDGRRPASFRSQPTIDALRTAIQLALQQNR